MAVLVRQDQRVTAGHAARDDRDLEQRVEVLQLVGDEGVAGLVVGDHLVLAGAADAALALGPKHDAVDGLFELGHADALLVDAGGQDRGLVDQVGQVGAGEAGRALGERRPATTSLSSGLPLVWTSRMATRPLTSGASMIDLAVEAAGAQQRRVEDVGAVGGGDDDDVGVRVEAVHLDEDLVQGLLALVVAAAEAGAALAADRVDLVDEDDAGRVALGLVEQVAHAGGADADEHLDELGAGDREEGHAGLAGDGAGEQRLAGAGRADEQDAARDARAQGDELLRVLEELDDFLQLFLRFVHAGDVDEGDGGLVGGEHARAALAEAHGLGVGALRLAHHEEDQADEDQDRQELQQQADPVAELRSAP